jgi:prepilin-type N-terminal cleavage/methylation domain-containing protein
MQLKRQQKGFTLVEIAVVLVIIGLLLGGVLKGQELIASARVRNMADQQAGIQAAFYGFQDRYRAVPGDMTATAASNAIGQSVTLGANPPSGSAPFSDGQLSAPSASGAVWQELNGVWEQLSKAGFIKGSYDGSNGTAPPDSTDGPINVFNGQLIMARHAGYQDTGTAAARLVLHLGRNVPVDIARELDTKLDDGQPQTGTLRNATQGSEAFESGSSSPACVGISGGPTNAWNIAGDAQDCNPTYLF